MKITSGALALVMALGCSGAVSAIAQDRDRHDQPQAHEDHQNRDESSFYSNKNYQLGWKEGQKHKHKDHKWKNDTDRQAYEAGFSHGDHGEQWKDPNHR
jgi:hypothetical protein